jgi:hypothetical protein
LRQGRLPFIAARGGRGGAGQLSMATTLRAAKGQGDVIERWATLRRSWGASTRGKPCTESCGRGHHPGGQWRRTSTLASSTGHGGERERVWQVPGVMATLLADADGEARSRSMGHRGALARSASRPCRPWRHWLTWACPVLAGAGLSLASGWYQQGQ